MHAKTMILKGEMNKNTGRVYALVVREDVYHVWYKGPVAWVTVKNGKNLTHEAAVKLFNERVNSKE